MSSLANARVLIVGGLSGIAQRLASDLIDAGSHLILAGRDLPRTQELAAGLGPNAEAIRIDLDDETTITDAASRLGSVDHVINFASAPANGAVTGLDRAAIEGALAAKVVGPLLLAKHFAPLLPAGGAFVLFSGLLAWRPSPERVVTATANGAVSFLVEALAVELAPVRAVAISPGIIDSGVWDRLGPAKEALFDKTAATNPSRRIGTPEDVSSAVQLALTNTFITGTTLHVDGGGRLA